MITIRRWIQLALVVWTITQSVAAVDQHRLKDIKAWSTVIHRAIQRLDHTTIQLSKQSVPWNETGRWIENVHTQWSTWYHSVVSVNEKTPTLEEEEEDNDNDTLLLFPPAKQTWRHLRDVWCNTSDNLYDQLKTKVLLLYLTNQWSTSTRFQTGPVGKQVPSKQEIAQLTKTYDAQLNQLFLCTPSSSSSSSVLSTITQLETHTELVHLFTTYLAYQIQCAVVPHLDTRTCSNDWSRLKLPPYRWQFRRTADPSLVDVIGTVRLGLAIPSLFLYCTVLCLFGILYVTGLEKRIKVE